jgi:hypothetical protein
MSSKAQRQVILGLETVPGDGATPDVALRAKASLEAVAEKQVPDEDIGSYAPQRHVIVQKMAKGKLEMDGYYEHAPYPISMALGAGQKSGAGDPWTYTWALPDGTAPTFATYRLECTDGNNHIVRSDDTFATALEIKGEAGKTWQIEAEIGGGDVTYPAALGASLTPPAAVTAIRMADTTLEMEDDYDDLGAGNVTVLISFSWKVEDLQHQKQFAGSLFPNGRGNDKWKVTLELVVEIDDAKIEAEKDKLLTTAQTAIQIKGSASANDSCTISGMYFLSKVDTLDDRDGNNIVKLTYMAEKGSEGDLPSVVVTTNLSGL